MPRIPRLATYAIISTTLFTSVIFSALHSRPNFYSASVAIGRSSGSMMVLGNFALLLTILFGIGMKKVFFGQLRSVEYEHLFERLWLFLTESLLALTIFRDDFSTAFAVMFGALVFLKCFHWITADRIDYMDQVPPPGPPLLFHIRSVSIILILSTLDLLLVMYSLETILVDGVSAMVLFGSEFLILLASIWGTAARYVVNVVDIRRARGREDAPSWEEKSMWMFYIDLAVDFAKLLTYLSFFTVILMNYGIPLHILRDVWMTFRSFLSRCSDLVRYRRATRDMDAQYPDATEEDVGRLGDRVCIICREEMIVRGSPGQNGPTSSSTENAAPNSAPDLNQNADGVQGTAVENGPTATPTQASHAGPNETPKKLVCGHVFHFHCLRSWLERQQSCPTCRRDVLNRPTPTQTAQNGFNRPGVVPPPAPGAVPQPNGQANPARPTPPPANGVANPNPAEAFRAQWNQFFRTPEINGEVPLPAAGGVGLANENPVNVSSNGGSGSTVQSEEDARLQKSIWGGPIQPGRFFASPLGAAPRPLAGNMANGMSAFVGRPTTAHNNSSTTNRLPTTQGTAVPIPTATRPQGATVLQSESSSAIPGPSSPSRLAADEQTRSQSYTSLQSGETTPAFSQLPDIFRSPGEGSQTSKASDDAEEPKNARRAAAEAAMKRFGLGGQPRSESAPQLNRSSSAPAVEQVEIRDKGKGKEKAVDVLEGSPCNRPILHIPYLTPVALSFPHPQPLVSRTWGNQPSSSGNTSDLSGNGLELSANSSNGVVGALDEKLRVLKGVEDVIRDLVGELANLRGEVERGSYRGAENQINPLEAVAQESLNSSPSHAMSTE